MNLQTIRSHCLSKPGTTKERPFGPEVLVFKVMGKMFALTQDGDQPESINLKCDPGKALALPCMAQRGIEKWKELKPG